MHRILYQTTLLLRSDEFFDLIFSYQELKKKQIKKTTQNRLSF